MSLIERIRGFFKRQVTYNVIVSYQKEAEEDSAFPVLDRHIPIDNKYKGRMRKVEY